MNEERWFCSCGAANELINAICRSCSKPVPKLPLKINYSFPPHPFYMDDRGDCHFCGEGPTALIHKDAEDME